VRSKTVVRASSPAGTRCCMTVAQYALNTAARASPVAPAARRAAPAATVLALDASQVDLARRSARVPPGPSAGAEVSWGEGTGRLLGWLLAGRRHGPVFLTGRRASGHAAAGAVCPMTGRARMSYRRAAEIFTSYTRPLDPAGRGWTLHQLRPAPGAWEPSVKHTRVDGCWPGVAHPDAGGQRPRPGAAASGPWWLILGKGA
jgi:hypothetical protein